MNKKSRQSGQVLLVVLLVMVVGLTVGLSLATRSVSDVKISTQLEESSRAFSAAEAGIEAALKGDVVPAAPVAVGNASYTFTTSLAGGTNNPLPLGKIYIADTYTVWLTSHDSTTGSLQIGQAYDYNGTTIDVCWDQGAMEITTLYQGGTYKIKREAYDPDAARRSNNRFLATEALTCGGNFTLGKTINLPTGGSNALVALRLRPFYQDANVGIAPAGANTLPAQGIAISSTGIAGGTSRKVSVIQSYPSLPAIFDYVLFSGTGVTQ